MALTGLFVPSSISSKRWCRGFGVSDHQRNAPWESLRERENERGRKIEREREREGRHRTSESMCVCAREDGGAHLTPLTRFVFVFHIRVATPRLPVLEMLWLRYHALFQLGLVSA